MYDFAFVVVSYNQEKYVRQHLESIKYQIEHFGRNLAIQIIFSDDASKDSTVSIAREWLKANEKLFSHIDVIAREENVGTIRNMRDAIYTVDARHFKMLACDDLYFVNNIFEVGSMADIVLTPPVRFGNDGTFEENITPDYCLLLRLDKANLIKGIANRLKYNQCIPSPGVFIDMKFWKDPNLIEYIMKYKFVEDIAEWDYIFNRSSQRNFSVEILSKPYIMYRKSVGLGSQLEHIKSNQIGMEHAKIRKDIPYREGMAPKYINLFCYMHFWETHVTHKLWMKDEGKEKIKPWEISVKEARNYLDNVIGLNTSTFDNLRQNYLI